MKMRQDLFLIIDSEAWNYFVCFYVPQEIAGILKSWSGSPQKIVQNIEGEINVTISKNTCTIKTIKFVNQQPLWYFLFSIDPEVAH